MSVRKITIKSGNEEFTLDVTEEEYRNYFRPWWQQKKHEQRNREAMEKNGYTEESYEAWRVKTAVIQCREIKMVYENTNSERSGRIVQPLKISYKSKEWYLKAFCIEKQDFRIFKLNSILELELSEKTFVPKPYPEPENNLQQTYPQIVLLFAKEIAYRIYDEFDETEITYQKNGDLMVCAEMPVDAWLIGYLLSFGAQVEVMEPKYLKGVLAARAEEIYKKINPDKRCQHICVIVNTIAV